MLARASGGPFHDCINLRDVGPRRWTRLPRKCRIAALSIAVALAPALSDARGSGGCPGSHSSTHSSGPCPGCTIDQVTPLKRGGADTPYNMQWQMRQDARRKDKWE